MLGVAVGIMPNVTSTCTLRLLIRERERDRERERERERDRATVISQFEHLNKIETTTMRIEMADTKIR